MSSGKTSNRIYLRFKHRRNRITEKIKTQDLKSLVEEIQRTSDFHKLDRYIMLSNNLAKKIWERKNSGKMKKEIEGKAYQVKHVSLLTLYKDYPSLVTVERDSRNLVFRYQAGGMPQTYHIPISYLKETLKIGGFDIWILPKAIQEAVNIARESS